MTASVKPDPGWFGFATVTKPASPRKAVWHGFKRGVAGEPSLCGRVTYGPGYVHIGGRACSGCARIWERQYPPKAATA